MALLILPDIHGRPFWKKAVEDNIDKVDKVIFLGDYHDPYPWEGFTKKQSIDNFREIIELKRGSPEKVILLLGNHKCISLNI